LIAKFVQSVEDPWFESLQDHVVGAFDLSICPWVHHGCPIYTYVVIVAEVKELFASELCTIDGDDGVWDPKAMDNISKEEHRLLRLDSRDRLSLNPL
jgi:hypothetical protein